MSFLTAVFGAVAISASADIGLVSGLGESAKANSASIQQVIDTVSAAGGGRVTIPSGTWTTGTIYLKSNVELYLPAGARLVGSSDLGDYNPLDAFPQNYGSVSEGWSARHLILALEQTNVVISGAGVIDGNGKAFFGDRPEVFGDTWWRDGGINARDREHQGRPGQLIEFVECRGVRVDGIRIEDSPCWSCFFYGCDDVSVRGLHIDNPPRHLNTDGLDIDSCRHVSVRDCAISTGDDAIAVRCNSARLKDRTRICEDVKIENCSLGSSADGIRIGVGTGKIRNVRISNVAINRAGTGFHIQSVFGKSSGVDISDIRYSDSRIRGAARAIEIVGANGKRPRDIVVSRVSVEDSCLVEDSFTKVSQADDVRFLGVNRVPDGLGVTKVSTDAPGWTFTEDEQPLFRVAGCGTVVWSLEDWKGGPCGVATNAADGTLVFPRLLPGYYRSRGGTNEFSFCVVRRDPCRDVGSFFAADSALSECSRPGAYACPWCGGDSVRVTAELLGRCGVVHTRERLYWSAMEPKCGEYDFSHFLSSARKMKENGVYALGLISSTPSWMRRPGRSLPGDLIATYRFMAAATAAFDGYYDGWEFWNEPELGSLKEPVWEYVAALKAYALGARAGNSRVTILPGALSGIDHGGYGQNMFDGEIAKYVHAFNLHTYHPLARCREFHHDIRGFLSEAGIPGWQVWLTESGTELEGDAIEKGLRGYGAHSREQEMIVAEFYPKSNVLNRFGGIARNWFFLFGCYNERKGGKDWGSMRRDGSVKPVHAVIAAMTGELGCAEMLGAVKVGKGIRAFLYERKDGTQILVFWSPSPVDRAVGCQEVLGRHDSERREVRLSVPDGTYRLVDMMGTPSAVTVENGTLDLVSVRYPQYLTGKLGLNADVSAKNIGDLSRYRPEPEEDLTVVVRPQVDQSDFSITGRKCLAELERMNGRILVEVWNLSDLPKRGRLSFSCGSVECESDEIELPSWGKTDVPVVWTPPDGAEVDFKLDVSGMFGNKRITRVRIPVSYRWRFLSKCTAVALKGFTDPKAWSRNDSAQQYACRYDESEKALRFDVEWTEKGRQWFYPIHDLKLPEESFEGARYIEFEVKTAQDKVENDFQDSVFMLASAGKKDRWISYQPPTFNWEKRLVKLPEDCGSYATIRVGANPRGGSLTYWVRNFRLLKEKNR